MIGQEKVPAAQMARDGAKRERSRIGFPYLSLGEAMEVANAIHKNVGTSVCSDDQLAPWLRLSPKSSGYRQRLSASKMFGLVESLSRSTHKLTNLGRRIVDPVQASEAKAEAFLEVPLFRAAFEKYRGNSLPPASALEREFQSFGVARKQTGKARSSFERSANSAGYFNEGHDRLVKPGFSRTEASPDLPASDQGSTAEFGGGGDGPRHPFIEGLLETLPEPDTVWAIEGRVAWLKAAATCFDLIYRGDGTIHIDGKTAETTEAEVSTPAA